MQETKQLVIGIDEAGRGALAGPVVVASVAILNYEAIKHINLNDSKLLSPAKRYYTFIQLMCAADEGHIKIARVPANNKRIDKINILEATKECAERSMWGILYSEPGKYDERFTNASIKIDGNYNLVINDMPPFTNTVECVIKGDTKIPEIMAASIIAKVTRDIIMIEFDKEYPGYDFKNSKGYASKKHMEAIKKLGPCEIHRKTFSKVKEYV